MLACLDLSSLCVSTHTISPLLILATQIRIIMSRDADNYRVNSNMLFDENYDLAYTQHRKNKDIPEGGSKGTILLSLEHQDKGVVAFQK